MHTKNDPNPHPSRDTRPLIRWIAWGVLTMILVVPLSFVDLDPPSLLSVGCPEIDYDLTSLPSLAELFHWYFAHGRYGDLHPGYSTPDNPGIAEARVKFAYSLILFSPPYLLASAVLGWLLERLGWCAVRRRRGPRGSGSIQGLMM